MAQMVRDFEVRLTELDTTSKREGTPTPLDEAWVLSEENSAPPPPVVQERMSAPAAPVPEEIAPAAVAARELHLELSVEDAEAILRAPQARQAMPPAASVDAPRPESAPTPAAAPVASLAVTAPAQAAAPAPEPCEPAPVQQFRCAECGSMLTMPLPPPDGPAAIRVSCRECGRINRP